MKSTTLKDVLYALEFTNAKLCRSPAGAWTIEPGGLKVSKTLAETARARAERVESGLDGHETFTWRRPAA